MNDRDQPSSPKLKPWIEPAITHGSIQDVLDSGALSYEGQSPEKVLAELLASKTERAQECK